MLLILCVGLQVCEAGFGVVGYKHLGEINLLFKGGMVMVLGDGALVPDAWVLRIARSVLGVVRDVVGSCDVSRKVHFRTGLRIFLVVLVAWSSVRTPRHIGEMAHARWQHIG